MGYAYSFAINYIYVYREQHAKMRAKIVPARCLHVHVLSKVDNITCTVLQYEVQYIHVAARNCLDHCHSLKGRRSKLLSRIGLEGGAGDAGADE